jgi:hypothetical protein
LDQRTNSHPLPRTESQTILSTAYSLTDYAIQASEKIKLMSAN